jgi:glycosyltransferase involved in cell wall biosynthesis
VSTIAVVTSSPPFVEGGHLVIARALVAALEQAGHEADLILTPQNRFGRQGSAYLANWLTDVGRTSDGRPTDRVISLRFPSYAVRHPAHVCWLNHTMREYYDLWDRFSTPLSPAHRAKERLRRSLIHRADRYLLTRNVSKLFVQSETIRRRYAAWPELRAEVLYPPPPPRPYRVDDYEPYIFAVSRFTPLKRIGLIVEALARPEAAGIRAVLAGDGETRDDVASMVRSLGLEGRVSLPGRLSEEHLVDHLARCRAVVFPPVGEDFGFVTVEAFAAARPVITCRDSGGPAELVTHERSGLVVNPTPDALAAAFRRLIDDPNTAARFGGEGAALARTLTWPATVERLLVPVN